MRAVDNAGNRELAPSGNLPNDGTVVDVGGTPQVGEALPRLAVFEQQVEFVTRPSPSRRW